MTHLINGNMREDEISVGGDNGISCGYHWISTEDEKYELIEIRTIVNNLASGIILWRSLI